MENNKADVAAKTQEKTTEKFGGFPLEYDTARKIAQGLGAHLPEPEKLGGIIGKKGNLAVLLSISERKKALYGVSDRKGKKRNEQSILFNDSSNSNVESRLGSLTGKRTTLDQLHQAMLLFGEGKSEALRRFLVDEGAGNSDRFWRLANALSALYPKNSDERRWTDGVLSRKKPLGF